MSSSRHHGYYDQVKKPIVIDEGTNNRGATSNPKHVSPPLNQPPFVSPFDRVRFWHEHGAPAIFEYKDGVRTQTLTYPNNDHRPYYRVGDHIMVATLSKKFVEQTEPELKETNRDESTLLWLVSVLLGGGDESEYKVAWKIISIAPDKKGEGELLVRRVVFYGEVPCILKHECTFTWSQVNTYFIQLPSIASMMAMAHFIELEMEFLVDLSLAFVGGELAPLRRVLTKKMTSKAGRLIIRLGVKKFISRVMREVLLHLAKASAAFAIKFSVELAKDMKKHSRDQVLRQLAGIKEDGTQSDLQSSIHRAIGKGTDAFIEALVVASLEDKVTKGLVKGFEGMFGTRSGELKNKIEAFLAKEFLVFFSFDLFKELMQSVSDAAAGAWETGKFDSAKFEADLGKSGSELVNTMAKKKFKIWVERLEERLADEFVKNS